MTPQEHNMDGRIIYKNEVEQKQSCQAAPHKQTQPWCIMHDGPQVFMQLSIIYISMICNIFSTNNNRVVNQALSGRNE